VRHSLGRVGPPAEEQNIKQAKRTTPCCLRQLPAAPSFTSENKNSSRQLETEPTLDTIAAGRMSGSMNG